METNSKTTLAKNEYAALQRSSGERARGGRGEKAGTRKETELDHSTQIPRG